MVYSSKHKNSALSFDQKSKLAPIVSTAVLVMTLVGVTTSAIAQDHNPIGDLPQALICTSDDITAIGYLTRVNADGSAIYMAPNDIFVTVASDGRVGNRGSGTCSGKTIDELRAIGLTRDFAK